MLSLGCTSAGRGREMVSCRQLSILLCAAVFVCTLKLGESQIGAACPPAVCNVTSNSECRQGVCACKQGYYDDHGSICLGKKGLGESCTNSKECLESMHCEGGHCAANVNTTDINNSNNISSASTGDKLLMIAMFLLYLVVNRS